MRKEFAPRGSKFFPHSIFFGCFFFKRGQKQFWQSPPLKMHLFSDVWVSLRVSPLWAVPCLKRCLRGMCGERPSSSVCKLTVSLHTTQSDQNICCLLTKLENTAIRLLIGWSRYCHSPLDTMTIWAATWEDVPSDMFAQRRLKVFIVRMKVCNLGCSKCAHWRC